MSVIAEAVRHMLAAGMSHEAVVAAVEAMEAADSKKLTARQERNRRYYEKKASEKRLNASESVLLDVKVSPSDGFPPDPLSLTPPAKEKTPLKGVKKESSPKIGVFIKPDDVSGQVWDDFLSLRSRKKAPVTPTVIAGLRREAEKAGMSLQEAMAESCTNGWQGFKAEWMQNQKAAPPSNQRRSEPVKSRAGML